MSKNTTITRAQAIENAIRACQSVNEGAEFRTYWDDTIEVLVKMHEQLVKPRKATVSKARIANESLARKIAKVLPAEGLTSKGIVELGFPEVTTTQKAVAVMRVAEELELVERLKDGKTITFKPIASEGEEE